MIAPKAESLISRTYLGERKDSLLKRSRLTQSLAIPTRMFCEHHCLLTGLPNAPALEDKYSL